MRPAAAAKRVSDMSDSKQDDTPTPEESTGTAVEEPSEETMDQLADEAAAMGPGGEPAFEFVEPPEFEVSYEGDCLYKVGVTIAPANSEKKAEEIYGELQSEAEVPGFRRGKAPRRLLERKFGKVVRGEVVDKLVSAAFQKLIEEQELRPIQMPDLEDADNIRETPADTPLTFTLKFEVAPRVTLGEYKDLEIERPVLEIEESDVDEAIDRLRERHAFFQVVDDAEAQDGDQVVIDFEGKIDGEPFPGGAAQNYPYVLGSGRFFEEFEQALQGAKAGQSLSTDVTFPEGYGGAQDLGNKTATFEITVHEVKRRQMPEVDEDFAKQAGYESVEDLRTKVAEGLREGASDQSNKIAESRAMQAIVEASEYELPKSLIESSAKAYYDQETRRLMAMRVPASEIEAREEELRSEAEANALREIKGYFTINQIGEAEDVDVTEADFEKEAEAIRERTGAERETIVRFLQQADQREEYVSRIFRRKALEVVMDHAKLTDVPVSREEMEKQDADSDS